VAEAAVSGVRAAKAGGMAAPGVARVRDELLLRSAGADLVMDTLDADSLPALAEGRLVQREDVPQR
jgi:beta-phosphoglucomutase-like phosphatase (HAD superfamily)